MDSRICDEKTSEAVQGAAAAGFFSKSGLFKDSQGRALGVRNRPEQPEIHDLSRKAESTLLRDVLENRINKWCDC
ncbi:hypothetical protein [Helicobacter sp.]|uniref:hypothetical protein n=1 Tax=Helicobacter sp. TaxID=218 RepID=UPI00388D6C11